MLVLLRVENLDIVTRGVLLAEGKFLCLTLENPWRDNEVNVSCVPEGLYTVVKYYSHRHGETFKVIDVPGRSGIIFHKGNVEEDTEGCILLGMEIGTIEGRPAVMQSKTAMERFRNLMNAKGILKTSLHIIKVAT